VSVGPKDEVRARVVEIDGKLVLDDPDAVGVIRAVAKHNCRILFEHNSDRVAHFTERAKLRGLPPTEVVIVIINVDAPFGKALADALMPGFNWQEVRDRGEIPIARGLAGREGLQEALDFIDPEAAAKLRASEFAVIVVDQGVAEVYSVPWEL